MIIYSNFPAGVDEIEQLARKEQLEILKRDLHNREELRNPIFDDGENIEFLTRIAVRSRFMEVLSGKLDQALLKALKNMFFDIVYPIPTQLLKMKIW